MGQIAQRCGFVEFVREDKLEDKLEKKPDE